MRSILLYMVFIAFVVISNPTKAQYSFSLPPVGEGIPVLVGETSTLYGNSIANVPLNAVFTYSYTCNIGSQVGNNFVVTPTVGDIGTHSFTAYLIQGADTIDSETTTIRVFNKINSGTRSIMSFGNSLMATGFDHEMDSILGVFDDMTFNTIGIYTLGSYHHNAISGFHYARYVANSLSPLVKSGVLDVPAFFSDNSLATPDYVYVRLGVNDINGQTPDGMTEGELASILAYVETFVDAFLAYDSDIKVIIGLPSYCSSDKAEWDAEYDGTPYEDRHDVFISNMHRFYNALITNFRNDVYDRRVYLDYAAFHLDRTKYRDAIHTNDVGNSQLGIGLANTLGMIFEEENNYYVSTTGNDGNPGTLAQPFLTWNHGIMQLNAGDTLFVRAGVYAVTGAVSISANPNEGTAANPIVVMGYPGDATRPIIDGSLLNNTSLLRIENKYYWTVKNIEIRESHDTDGVYSNFCGINLYRSNQVRIENVLVHDIDGQGIRIQDCDTIYIRDCDSYNNYDPYNNGGKADGFQINSTPPTVSLVYFDNCRAWNNSDDGWDFLDNTRGVIDSCWAWANGYDTDGSGQGFKAGLQTGPPPDSAYIFTNNIAVYNSHGGMRANCNGQVYFIDSRWYNNICAFNLVGFNTSNQIGANMYTNVWRNNISYGNTDGDSWEDASTFIRDHNSWDIIGLTLSGADFLSVDTTGISAPRNIDGSLPDNNCYNYFMKLAPSSDLIDAGRTVGLPYLGDAPDLGPFEYDGEETPASTETDILAFTLAEQTGAATINTTLHTVAIEVALDTDVTSLIPTITLSYGATVIPLSGVARDFTNPVPYTVTAEDGVTHQEWTVTVTIEAADPVATTGSIVKFNGKIVKR